MVVRVCRDGFGLGHDSMSYECVCIDLTRIDQLKADKRVRCVVRSEQDDGFRD